VLKTVVITGYIAERTLAVGRMTLGMSMDMTNCGHMAFLLVGMFLWFLACKAAVVANAMVKMYFTGLAW